MPPIIPEQAIVPRSPLTHVELQPGLDMADCIQISPGAATLFCLLMTCLMACHLPSFLASLPKYTAMAAAFMASTVRQAVDACDHLLNGANIHSSNASYPIHALIQPDLIMAPIVFGIVLGSNGGVYYAHSRAADGKHRNWATF